MKTIFVRKAEFSDFFAIFKLFKSADFIAECRRQRFWREFNGVRNIKQIDRNYETVAKATEVVKYERL